MREARETRSSGFCGSFTRAGARGARRRPRGNTQPESSDSKRRASALARASSAIARWIAPRTSSRSRAGRVEAMPRSCAAKMASITVAPAIWTLPSAERSVRARSSDRAVRRYSTCGASSAWMCSTSARAAARIRGDLGIAKQLLRPLEHVLGEDLDDQHARHHRDRVLESGRELGEQALALAARAAAHHHREQHVLGDLGLREPEVARRLPHLLVAALVAEARLVARVGLEQALAEVRQGRARDVLDHLGAQVGQRQVANPRAEALDDRDDRERARDRIAHALLQQQLGLRIVRVVRRHVLGGQVQERLALAAQPRLPGEDRRTAIAGPRRDVATARESTVAAHASGDQGLLVGGVGEQLVAGPLELRWGVHGASEGVSRRVSPRALRAATYSYVSL